MFNCVQSIHRWTWNWFSFAEFWSRCYRDDKYSWRQNTWRLVGYLIQMKCAQKLRVHLLPRNTFNKCLRFNSTCLYKQFQTYQTGEILEPEYTEKIGDKSILCRTHYILVVWGKLFQWLDSLITHNTYLFTHKKKPYEILEMIKTHHCGFVTH